MVVSNIFYLHPYLGKWSNLTHFFGWVESKPLWGLKWKFGSRNTHTRVTLADKFSKEWTKNTFKSLNSFFFWDGPFFCAFSSWRLLCLVLDPLANCRRTWNRGTCIHPRCKEGISHLEPKQPALSMEINGKVFQLGWWWWWWWWWFSNLYEYGWKSPVPATPSIFWRQ